MNQQRPEVADVIRSCKTDFLTRYRVSQQQRKALQDMESCRNRHCPKCQGSRQAQWLEARAAELLPVPYFHAVFTLPHQLGPLALRNQRTVYGILFRAAALSLQTLARDPRHLGASIGFLALLHTWGQNLMHHPHLLCLQDGRVSFRCKNYRRNGSPTTLTLDSREFVRRLLQTPTSEPHQALDSIPSIPDPTPLCPCCRQGHLLRIQTLPPSPLTLQPRIRSP